MAQNPCTGTANFSHFNISRIFCSTNCANFYFPFRTHTPHYSRTKKHRKTLATRKKRSITLTAQKVENALSELKKNYNINSTKSRKSVSREKIMSYLFHFPSAQYTTCSTIFLTTLYYYILPRLWRVTITDVTRCFYYRGTIVLLNVILSCHGCGAIVLLLCAYCSISVPLLKN